MSIEITDRHPIDRAEEILTDEALAFLEKLHQNFAGRRDELLAARTASAQAAAAGEVAGLPARDRRDPRAATGRWPRPRRRCRTAGSR